MKKASILLLICFLIPMILVSGCSSAIDGENVEETQTSEIDENFVEGELIQLSADQLLIKQDDGTETSLNLSEDTVYWEGIEWLTVFPVLVGDQILAYGEWTNDQTSFNVDQYYNNRLILKGIVTYSSGETGGYMVNQPGQNYLILPLPDRTELLTTVTDDPRSFRHFKLLPRPAEYIEVVIRTIKDPFAIAVRMTRFE